MGVVNIPPGVVWDTAFDEFDRLWVSFEAFGSQQAQYTGLWIVDVPTLNAYRVQAVIPTYAGLEFVPDPPAPVAYCQGKLNSLGCAPSISATGWPSSTASSGFEVHCANVRNMTSGLLFASTNGRAVLPFQGGRLCMNGPWLRTPLVSSGGNPLPAQDCSGTWTSDLNSFLFTRPPLPGGTQMQLQWYGRDTGSPRPVALSNALEVILQP